VPAFSFCGARSSASVGRGVPRRSERFRGVPPPRCLISVSFLVGGELVGQLRQLAHRDAESIGDIADGGPLRICVTSLDQGQRAPGEAGFLAESHLRDPSLFPKLSNRLAERRLWPI
jgi:hypothetical protein